MLRYFFILLCSLHGWIVVCGQQSKHYVFTHLTNSSGLASNVVNSIVQDNKGFIWIGTINGLQRYDGNKFLTFRNTRDNPHTIPNDNVLKLHMDKKARLWVLSAGNKIGIFNTGNFTYKEIPVRLLEDVNRFHTHISEDKEGRVSIVFSKYRMVTYDEKKEEFNETSNLMLWPTNWPPIILNYDSLRNNYWLATDSGIIQYNGRTRHFNYPGHNVDKDPIIEKMASYTFNLFTFVEKNGRFWLCRWVPLMPRPELYSFDPTSNKISAHEPVLNDGLKDYHEIKGMTSQKNGKVWVWGQPFLAELNPKSETLELLKNQIENDYSIHFDVAQFFYEDREENLWVCTNNGIFLFNPTAQLFTNLNNVRPGSPQASQRFVSDFLQVKPNELWVSSWGDGLYSYDSNFRPIPNPISTNPRYKNLYAFNMLKRSNGEIWIGCQFGQLIIYNPATGQIKDFYPAALEKKNIRQIAEDKRGRIWIGSNDGHLVRWDSSGRDSMETSFSLINHFKSRVLKIFIDHFGFVWVGTDIRGAFKIDPATGILLEHYEKETEANRANHSALMADGASDILQYNDSIMLIASGALNILNTRTGRISYFGTGEGLPSNNILNIVQDKRQFLWLGLSSGLTRMNYEKKTVASYSSRNGIINDNFQLGASAVLPDGRIAIGTNHDFLVFQPTEVARSETSPDIAITSLKVVNTSLPLDSLMKLNQINLQYYEYPVSIEFSALNYKQQNQLTYYYQLEGIDKNWVRSESSQVATYAYLPPGTYTFKVRSENGFGNSSQEITSFVLSVQPPLWKSWWFYASFFLIIVGILYLMDKERIKRLLELQKVRTEIADNLHKDVNTTLNNINLLSEIAKIKVDKDITKSKEYIDQINSKSRKMIDDMDDMLWSIDPQNDNIQRLLERMIEYAEGLKNTHACTIEVVVDDKVRSIRLSMKTRHEMFLIFKKAITNVAEHSSCTNSIINIGIDKSLLTVQIWDKRTDYDIRSFQQHIEVEEMQRRAAEINGALHVKTNQQGITVMLEVPVM